MLGDGTRSLSLSGPAPLVMLAAMVVAARACLTATANGTRWALLGLTQVLLLACSEPAASQETEAPLPNVAGAAAGGAQAVPQPDPFADAKACALASPGAAAPETVATLISFVNELPKPATIPCLLASLPRPLHVSVSDSALSAQRTEDPRSPRIFVFLGALIVTVLPEGKASALLEIGQLVAERDSLKAELKFPIAGPLQPGDAFDRILEAGGTKCGTCHGYERAAPEYGKNAFVSEAVEPQPETRVPLAVAQELHRTCDPAQEPARCAVWSGVFDYGEVLEAQFPDALEPLF